MKPIAIAAALTVACIVPFAVSAANDGELWEVTSQMSMPGMPAGMGGMTQRVCQDKDPAKHKPQGPNQENCKVTDRKQSGNRSTVTMVCPDGKMTVDTTYNAARSEYKGTMRMTTKEGDEMTMNVSGRKVGACDVAEQRREQQQMQAKVQSQVDEANRAMKQRSDEMIRDCAAAVETMDVGKLGIYGQCQAQPDLCKAMDADPSMKPVKTACVARQAEFCKRYRTEDGFLKAKASEGAAKMCGVSAEEVRASLCPAALKKESLPFLARHCTAEARPLAEKHCAGRDFTSLGAGGRARDKYDDFCQTYLANASIEQRQAVRPTPAPQAAEKPKATDAVQQGVTQGINKLRGIFGR